VYRWQDGPVAEGRPAFSLEAEPEIQARPENF